jgi:hypothetical protein
MMSPVLVAAAMLAVGAAAPPVVAKLGVYDYFTEESTPVIFNGVLLMLESIPTAYASFDPAFAACSAYFRVRDMKTLAVVVNISATCGQAFGAATVVPGAAGASDTLVVTGTQWDRRSLDDAGWSGPCAGANPANCTINVFSSSSPLLEDASWVTHAPGVRVPFGVYNSDVMRVPDAAGTPFKWVMALEAGQTGRFLTSAAAAPTDVAAWALLDASYTLPRLPDVGSCPSLRHDGTFFYYLTGGTDIHILRSIDLRNWTESPRHVLSHGDPGDCVVAPAFFGPYVPTGVALQHLQTCGPNGNFGDDSDVDLVEWPAPFGSAANGPAVLLEYGSGDQRSFGFSNLALVNASMIAFLQSFFP